MEYEEILKILGVGDDFFGYMKELECKFYIIKENIDKYGKEAVDDFIESGKYKFFKNFINYVEEKEIFDKYNEFYKNKYKHKILYEKFKEGIVFTDEELKYIENKDLLSGFKDFIIKVDEKGISDLRKINKLFPKNIIFFDCSYNENLIDLKGGPKEAKEYICTDCGLTSLEGAPKKVEYFNCSNNKYLKSLKGAPREVKKFYCSKNYNLLNLKYGPEEVEEYDCFYCGLVSLEGAPRKVKFFNCSNNNIIYEDGSKLKNLIGGPEEVEEFYDCSNCRLESLEGLAKKIGILMCYGNEFNRKYVEKFIKENNIEVKEILM